jgi:hypothetical protein
MDESAEASDDNVEQFVNTGVEVDWKKFKEWRSLTDNEAVNWSPGIGGGNGDDCMFNDGRLTFSDWLTAQCGLQELCTEKLVLGEVNTIFPGQYSRLTWGCIAVRRWQESEPGRSGSESPAIVPEAEVQIF